MKTNRIAFLPLAILLGIGLLAAGLWTSAGEQKRHAGLKRGGELRLQEAAQIALDNFRITSAELEEERRLVWSFEIAAIGLMASSTSRWTPVPARSSRSRWEPEDESGAKSTGRDEVEESGGGAGSGGGDPFRWRN
jgi:hypothetical protein